MLFLEFVIWNVVMWYLKCHKMSSQRGINYKEAVIIIIWWLCFQRLTCQHHHQAQKSEVISQIITYKIENKNCDLLCEKVLILWTLFSLHFK